MFVFEHVGKTFYSRKGDVQALQDIDFEVRPNAFVSLVGPSGCGKSTLLRLAAGLIPASTGRVLLEGVPVVKPTERLAMVFQSAVLLEWRDVLGNVMFPIEIMSLDRKLAIKRAKQLIKMVGLSGFERRHPRELSGGMQQRVALCRALVYDPPVLLMDEPFGALDAMTRDEMGEELLKIWTRTRKTILFVTHSIDEAVYLSDQVVVLSFRPGRVSRIVDIDLPRPRDLQVRYQPRFGEFCKLIRDSIERMSHQEVGS